MYIFPECSIGQDTYRGNPWEPWTLNLYAYAGNNPVNYVDPTGHFRCRSIFPGLLGCISAGVAWLGGGLVRGASWVGSKVGDFLGRMADEEIAAAVETGEMSSTALGEEGQALLEQLVGGSGGAAQQSFLTSMGRRIVDYLRYGVAYESKNGFVQWSSKIAIQIDKDAELLAKGEVKEVIWHLWKGADRSVLDYLAEHGIQWVIHE